jgi:hypothetical protein
MMREGQWQQAKPYHHLWIWNYVLDDVYHHKHDTCIITRHPFNKLVRRKFPFARDAEEAAKVATPSFPVEAKKYPCHLGILFHQIFDSQGTCLMLNQWYLQWLSSAAWRASMWWSCGASITIVVLCVL